MDTRILETQQTPTTTGTETIENHGATQIRCRECGRWVRTTSERIRHANYCESKSQPSCPVAAPVASRDAYVRAVAHQGAVSAVCSEDEILDRVRTGRLSENDAMNRDF